MGGLFSICLLWYAQKKQKKQRCFMLLNDQHRALEIKKGCSKFQKKRKIKWKKRRKMAVSRWICVCVGLLMIWDISARMWRGMRHQLVTFIFSGHFGLVMEASVHINKKHFQKSHWLVGWLVLRMKSLIQLWVRHHSAWTNSSAGFVGRGGGGF